MTATAVIPPTLANLPGETHDQLFAPRERPTNRRRLVYQVPVDGSTAWTAIYSTITHSATRLVSSANATHASNKHLVVTGVAGQQYTYAQIQNLGAAHDLSGTHIQVSLQMDNADFAKLERMYLCLKTGSGGWDDNVAVDFNYLWYMTFPNAGQNESGIVNVGFGQSAADRVGGSFGGWDKIQGVRIYLHWREAATVGTVRFLAIRFFEKYPVCLVMPLTDGSYVSMKQGAAYMTAKGIRAHHHVSPANVDSPDLNRMRIQDVWDLRRGGHSLGMYMNAAGSDTWALLTNAQKINQIRLCQRWAVSKGIPEAGHWISPIGGGYGDGETEEVLYPRVKGIMSGSGNWLIQVKGSCVDLCSPTSPWSGTFNSTTVATLQTRYAAAKADGGVYAIQFHGVDGGSGNCTWAEFTAMIDAIAADVEAGNCVNVIPDELASGEWMGRVPDYTVATLTGTTALARPRRKLYLDPGGASRNLTITGMRANEIIDIHNTADAAENIVFDPTGLNLTVMGSAGGVFNQDAALQWTGSAWRKLYLGPVRDWGW